MNESSNIPSTSSKAIFNDKLMVHFSDEEQLDYGPDKRQGARGATRARGRCIFNF
jgi:hypothetical protein